MQRWIPRPDLRPFVDSYWLIGHPPGGVMAEGVIFPLGYTFVEINFTPALALAGPDADQALQSVFFGMMSGPRRFRFQGAGHSFLIRLHPWATGAFLGQTAVTATDAVPALESVAGGVVSHLEEGLYDVTRLEEGIRRLEDWLAGRFRYARPVDPRLPAAVRAILIAQGQLTVAGLCRRLGRSDKWVEQLFAGHVGMTPKAYIDVARFQYALQRLVSGAEFRLTGLAYEAGYYDQAHFIRHFRRFTRSSPGAMTRRLEDPAIRFALRNSNLYNLPA